MSNPNQARDARGRFARSASLSAESVADRRAAEAERRKVDKAKRNAEIFDEQSRIDEMLSEQKKLRNNRPTRRDDPHDVLDWQRQSSALADKLRRARSRLKQLRSTSTK